MHNITVFEPEDHNDEHQFTGLLDPDGHPIMRISNRAPFIGFIDFDGFYEDN